MGKVPSNRDKITCKNCNHSWIPAKKKWYESKWDKCPNCNEYPMNEFSYVDEEAERMKHEKMVDRNRVEHDSNMAAEMSIEELQELINAKKLEESKPAAEMSIEELKSVIKLKASVKTEPNKKPTDVLYIVAILLGLLGGIIGYVIAKNDDEDMANNLLIVGIATSVIVLFLYFVLIASLF